MPLTFRQSLVRRLLAQPYLGSCVSLASSRQTMLEARSVILDATNHCAKSRRVNFNSMLLECRWLGEQIDRTSQVAAAYERQQLDTGLHLLESRWDIH